MATSYYSVDSNIIEQHIECGLRDTIHEMVDTPHCTWSWFTKNANTRNFNASVVSLINTHTHNPSNLLIFYGDRFCRLLFSSFFLFLHICSCFSFHQVYRLVFIFVKLSASLCLSVCRSSVNGSAITIHFIYRTGTG